MSLDLEWRSAPQCNGGNCLEVRWQKSSHSYQEGNCVEARWAKSSHSYANGNCPEARTDDGVVQLRDSKQNGLGPTLSFSPAEWAAFIAAIKLT